SFPEYDSFCFEIEPNQARLINLVKNDISYNSSNDLLLEEVDLFLSNNSIPPGIENVADDPEGDIQSEDTIFDPVYDDDFEDIKYVEASLSDPEIVSIEEENGVQQEQEEIDLEYISQIQDVVLREKLLIIIRLISNIESL
nr:hypothetical protein [Tanacetum cinerariifolium]